jgi:hypothetical protein
VERVVASRGSQHALLVVGRAFGSGLVSDVRELVSVEEQRSPHLFLSYLSRVKCARSVIVSRALWDNSIASI